MVYGRRDPHRAIFIVPASFPAVDYVESATRTGRRTRNRYTKLTTMEGNLTVSASNIRSIVIGKPDLDN